MSEENKEQVEQVEDIAPNEESGSEPEDELELPKSVPYSRFSQQTAKLRETEKELERLKADSSSDLKDIFEKGWGWADNPQKQAEEDITILNTLDEMRDDPEVQKALAKVGQRIRGGHAIAPRQREVRQVEQDPTVQQLVRERAADIADSVLEKSKVRPELRPVLREAAISAGASREAVVEAIRGKVSELGWSSEFLRGKSKEPTIESESSNAQQQRSAPPKPPREPKDRAKHYHERRREILDQLRRQHLSR